MENFQDTDQPLDLSSKSANPNTSNSSSGLPAPRNSTLTTERITCIHQVEQCEPLNLTTKQRHTASVNLSLLDWSKPRSSQDTNLTFCHTSPAPSSAWYPPAAHSATATATAYNTPGNGRLCFVGNWRELI